MAYFTDMATQLGMNVWLFVIILIWSLAWKLAAILKAFRRRSLFWIIILAFVNIFGILEILYIFIFSEWEHTKLIRHHKVKPVKAKKKKR